MESIDIHLDSPSKPIRYQFAKLILATAAGFVATKVAEMAFDRAYEAKTTPPSTDS